MPWQRRPDDQDEGAIGIDALPTPEPDPCPGTVPAPDAVPAPEPDAMPSGDPAPTGERALNGGPDPIGAPPLAGPRSVPHRAPEPARRQGAAPRTPPRPANTGARHRPMTPARPVGAPRTARTSRKSGNARPIVFAVAALVVLGGVGVGVISSLGDELAPEDPQAAPEPVDPTQSAEETANAFVEALRSADADALAEMLGGAAAPDPALFTDDVLAKMLERHPMTRESIAAVGIADAAGGQVVDISYLLGDAEISYTIDVDTTAPDPTGAIEIDLPSLTFDGGYGDLDVSVNGVAVTTGSGDMYAVMPGVYDLATSADHLRLEGEPIVATTGFAYAYTHEHDPLLTGEGLAEFRSRVRASAEECLASTALDASCGLSVTGGLQGGSSLVDGTIERTIDDDSWAAIDALEPTPSAGDPLVMRDGFFSAEVVFIGDWTGPSGSGRDQIYGGPSLVGPSVDFGDPDLPVTWGY